MKRCYLRKTRERKKVIMYVLISPFLSPGGLLSNRTIVDNLRENNSYLMHRNSSIRSRREHRERQEKYENYRRFSIVSSKHIFYRTRDIYHLYSQNLILSEFNYIFCFPIVWNKMEKRSWYHPSRVNYSSDIAVYGRCGRNHLTKFMHSYGINS